MCTFPRLTTTTTPRTRGLFAFHKAKLRLTTQYIACYNIYNHISHTIFTPFLLGFDLNTPVCVWSSLWCEILSTPGTQDHAMRLTHLSTCNATASLTSRSPVNLQFRRGHQSLVYISHTFWITHASNLLFIIFLTSASRRPTTAS